MRQIDLIKLYSQMRCLVIDDMPDVRVAISGMLRVFGVQQIDVVANPSIELQLAARSQHICRWKIPRSQYPMDRQGYKKWRLDLAVFHGETAGDILLQNDYSLETVQRVKDLLLKRSLKRDDEVQALEDVICLVFLEFYLEDFASKHDEAKLIDIIQKTWNKMSDAGHTAALELPFSEAMLALVSKALQ